MLARVSQLGALVAAGCLLSTPASAQGVDTLEILALRSNPAAGPDPTPYSFEVCVTGSGLGTLSLEALQGARGPIALLPGDQPGEFGLEGSYASLAALRQDWPAGNYRLNVNLGAMVLDVTHAPSEPLQPTLLIAPVPGDRCVPLPLDLEWASCGACGGTEIYLELEEASGVQSTSALVPLTDTLWSPPPGFLQPGTEYLGRLEVVNLEQRVTLASGTEYVSAFVLENGFEFRTAFVATETVVLGSPPNPAALQPGILGPPRLGQVWAPRIDHTAFAPAASFDVLAVDLRPAINLPRAVGTLLLQPPPPDQIFVATPGTPFQLAIPPDCQLAGREVMSQGLSFTPQQGISLTNGLLLRLGSQ